MAVAVRVIPCLDVDQGRVVKGETSGHTQEVLGVRLDCDGDTILLTVRQRGGACHTGDRTCFDATDLLGGQS